MESLAVHLVVSVNSRGVSAFSGLVGGLCYQRRLLSSAMVLWYG